MADNKLIPYWIKVREVEEPDTDWEQTSIHTNEPQFPEDNLADYMWDFLQKYSEDVHIDEDDQKTFTIGESLYRDGNTIEGVIKSGEWGHNADFWDIDEHERIEDAREENHAEEIPYYFLFHIPDEDNERALLILRKYKRKGIKTLFSNLFLPRNRDMDIGDAYTELSPHYSDEVIEKMEDADGIASVRFRGKESIATREEYAERHDVEEMDSELNGQMDVGIEHKITPKDNQDSFLEFVKGMVPSRSSDDTENFDYGRIESESFSSASVTVVEGESQLTFSLWKEEVQMRMDVDPDEYSLDIVGGHPTARSLGVVARQLANDLMKEHNTKLDTESLVPRKVGVPEE